MGVLLVGLFEMYGRVEVGGCDEGGGDVVFFVEWWGGGVAECGVGDENSYCHFSSAVGVRWGAVELRRISHEIFGQCRGNVYPLNRVERRV